MQNTRGNVSKQNSSSYIQHLMSAHESFLKETGNNVADKIKGRLETHIVKKSVSSVWLELKGVCRSDMCVDVFAHIVEKTPTDVMFIVQGTTARHGAFSTERVFKMGELTTDVAARTILECAF